MRTTVNRIGKTLLIASAALALASYNTAGGRTGSASAPAGGGPLVTSAQGLQATLAGNSLVGEAISGDTYCSYYAPNGSMTRVFQGFAPEYGSWMADGTAVCETVNQVTGCSRFDFGANGQVTVTSLEGSGGFATPAVMVSGNQCGA